MKRVLCVRLPLWPVQRFRHARPAPDRQALVLYATGRRGQAVAACSPGAARAGVAPGMPLAEARALAADARFEPHEPRDDREALRRLAIWCQQFSPEVALEEVEQPECLFLDVTGSGALYGGEPALARKVTDDLGRHGYLARVAIADTVGAAHAVARYGGAPADSSVQATNNGCHGFGTPNPCEPAGDRPDCDGKGSAGSGTSEPVAPEAGRPLAPLSSISRSTSSCDGTLWGALPGPAVVPPSGQRAALGPLPVEALRLSPAVVQTLHRLDVRRVEQLLALPRAALPSRFGKEILHRIDQALGHVPELLTPEPIPEPVEVAWPFEPATDDWQVIGAVCGELLEQVVERLRPRQLGIRRLECSLRITAGEPVPLSVGLLQPSASVPHLTSLVRLHCERLRVEGEVSALAVRAAEVVPLEFCQAQLFEGDAGRDWRRAFPGLIERLSNRLGEKAVLRPRLLPDAQPEHAYRLEPWLGQTISTGTTEPPPENAEGLPLRPPCLKGRPVAVPVVSPAPDGPPLQFIWQEECHVVARSWGPERIETGWWRGRDVRRDYYLVESTAGKRFWLFRAVREGDWFLHGTFA